ncbi:MAG TPA: hypothetical protein VMT99_00045 [Candidatus Paceibacterota bacterium]|nr:hypothetical protein [Candidatus Paceibacterota bacterium]
MKTGPFVGIILIIVVIAAALLVVFYPRTGGVGPATTATSTTGTPSGTPATSGFDQSISDGVITISYPSAMFGLATNPTQILVHPYIPPCSGSFDYCFYYVGDEYQGTNFESAGIRVETRADLANERLCLTTPPQGFTTAVPSATSSADAYSTSVFGNVGDAAAGHFSSGSLYRLYYRPSKACYEFETRIGESDYANYPSGTIGQFSAANQAALQAALLQILDGMTLPSSTPVSFPTVTAAAGR